MGVSLTSWRYLWRTTPVDRKELAGAIPKDAPPPLPGNVTHDEVQRPEDGVGPLVHRIYRTRIHGAQTSPERLMGLLQKDLDAVAPSEFASFQKLTGDPRRMAVGDEYVVRMPGPWDGPVRVIALSPTSFRLATLEGHLEAGQIEFRALPDHRALEFVIESWACSGDRLSDLLYTRLRMSKEVQLHMWTSVLERVVAMTSGEMAGGIVVTTRRVDADVDEPTGGLGRGNRPARRALERLEGASLNFDPDPGIERTPDKGWHVDDLTEPLPHEPSGPPAEDGSWEVARELMLSYQVADPAVVRATYQSKSELAGRDMLLTIRYMGVRFRVGVRVGEVYDEQREVEGRSAQVFGWDYSTLEGHFEQGRIHYEVWKWLDTGDVEFRLHAFSRVADSGPLILRLGYLVVGRRHQLAFYRRACNRMRRLTQGELESRRTAAYQSEVAELSPEQVGAPS
jgi:uncharacterized protein (UPF0548 family)